MVPTDDWRYTLGAVAGGHFLSHLYLLAFPPLFPLFRAEFGLDNAELGALVSAIALATFLQFPVGNLVDRIGAKWVLVLGLVVTSSGVLLAGLAPSYPTLLAFALLSGVGQSAFHPADYALLDAVTSASSQGKSFSVHTFFGHAGFAVAPLVVGTIGLERGRTAALVSVGAVGLCYALVLALTLEPSYLNQLGEREAADAPESEGRLVDVVTPTILVLFGFFFLLTMGSNGARTFTPVFAAATFGVTEAVGNLSLTAFAGATSIGVLVGGVLADRHPPRRVVVVAMLVAAGVVWAIASGTLPTGTVAAVVPFGVAGFAVGLVMPSRDRLVNAASSAGSTGRSFGFVFTGISLGALVAPVLVGAVIDAVSTTVALAAVGGFFVAGAIVVGLLLDPVTQTQTSASAGD